MVIFCTENCRAEAMLDYHDIECLVLQDIFNYNMGIDAQVALQIVIKGWKECNDSFSNFSNIFTKINDEPCKNYSHHKTWFFFHSL